MTKTALITGATSGIGLEIADILAGKGYNIFLVSRNKKKLDEVAMSLEKKYGITAFVFPIDLSHPEASTKVFLNTIKQRITIDVLINNAGIGIMGESVQSDKTEVKGMLDLNIIALTELTNLFGQRMKERKQGHILNVSSVVAYQPVPYFAAYAASKSYVLHFSEAVAKELEEYNVVVTCLSPGATKTAFFSSMGKESFSKGMPSRVVAQKGVTALFSRKLSVIPGFKNNVVVFLDRLLPRTIVARITKKMMK